MGVGNRLESIAIIVPLSLSMTLPPFISQNYGAEKVHRVKDAYLSSMKFVLIWQALVFLLMWLMSSYIAKAFAQDAEVERLIIMFLSIVPLCYGLQGIVILTNSSLNAMHRPMSALILSFLRFFVFFIPVAYVGHLFFGLQGIFWGGVVAYFSMGVVSYLWFTRLMRNDLEQTAPDDAAVREGA